MDFDDFLSDTGLDLFDDGGGGFLLPAVNLVVVCSFAAGVYWAYKNKRYFHFKMRFPDLTQVQMDLSEYELEYHVVPSQTPWTKAIQSAISVYEETNIPSDDSDESKTDDDKLRRKSRDIKNPNKRKTSDKSDNDDSSMDITLTDEAKKEDDDPKFTSPIKDIDRQPINHKFDQPIRAQDLPKVYREKLDNSGQQFKLEFQYLAQKSKLISKPALACIARINIKKNRYSNVYPYDDRRVVLSGNVNQNYINASFAEGYKSRKRFIATQGPKWNTISDFWRMIWEFDVHTIVMLCNVLEDGREKCIPYWTAGNMEILFVKQDAVLNLGGILLRRVSLGNIKTKKMRQIEIYQYTTWPDHGIPKTTTLVMYLHRMVNERQTSRVPVVVHCSAGAGRSGTYIAMDYLFDQLKEDNKVNVSRLVFELRLCRSEMIQKEEQYQFVYTLLLERYLFPESDFFVNDFLGHKLNSALWTNKIAKEFQYLKRFGISASGEENEKKRRTVLRWQGTPTLSEDATEMETLYLPLPVIVTSMPPKTNKEIFWKMVVENNVVCLITLDEQLGLKEFSGDKGVYPVDAITVRVLETEKREGYSLRYLKIFDANKLSVSLVHLYVTCWTDVDSSPEKPFFDDIINNIKDSIYKNTHRKVVISCDDGTSKSGPFLSLVELIERLKVNKRIDVFRTIKDLKAERPQLVQTLEIYKHLYKFIHDYASIVYPGGIKSAGEEYGIDYTNVDPDVIGLPVPEGVNVYAN